MDMNRKNHVGNGLRWMEALAREQIAANTDERQAESTCQPGPTQVEGDNA